MSDFEDEAHYTLHIPSTLPSMPYPAAVELSSSSSSDSSSNGEFRTLNTHDGVARGDPQIQVIYAPENSPTSAQTQPGDVLHHHSDRVEDVETAVPSIFTNHAGGLASSCASDSVSNDPAPHEEDSDTESGSLDVNPVRSV